MQQDEHDSHTQHIIAVNHSEGRTRVGVPVQDAHGGLSVFDEAHSAVVVPLVLDGHAADLHHRFPQLLGRAPALLGTRELLARRRQQLTQL